MLSHHCNDQPRILKGDRERCLDSGMNYYISKPVKIEEMRMSFERACQRLKPEQVLDRASIDNLRDNLEAIRLSDICK